MTTIRIISCKEFDGDFKHLSKKYKSLKWDMENIVHILKRRWLNIAHIERINNLWQDIKIPVYKMRRVWCESLKTPSKLRLIFAYDEKNNEIQLIQFLELYAKWEKEVEDRDRIRKYLSGKDHIE
jgi:hypothetical protein